MPLSSTTVNGTAVPGLLQSISTGTPSVGQQTQSPGANLKSPTNTTSTPVPTTSVKDLSGQYASIAGTNGAPATIYNKTTGQGYPTAQDFFNASGVNNFNNLKFDTTWQPPAPTQSSSTGLLPALANQSPIPQSTQTPNSSAPNSYGLLNAPNNGTTGVSQGNLINTTAQQINNPQWNAANAQLQQDQDAYAKAKQSVGNTAFGASEGIGAGGALDTLYNQKIANDTALINAANTKQANNTSSLSAASSANAPIASGAYQSPSATSTTGQTTSGASSLSSLIGQRPNASGTTEFYNTQTGQVFANPQALANFVNQQMPGINADASNVFGLLQATQSNQPVTTSSPFYQTLQTFAQQMANNNVAAVPYSSFSPAIQSQLLQMAKAINPNFDFNTATAAGAASQAITGTQTQQAATWKSAQQQSQALTGQLQPLLSQINPSQFTFVNGVIQGAADLAGNATYKQAGNLLTEIANTYANVLNPSGGTLTDSVRSTATGMINSLASGQSIAQVIAGLDAQAQAKINAIPTGTNLTNLTSSSGSIPQGSLTITTP